MLWYMSKVKSLTRSTEIICDETKLFYHRYIFFLCFMYIHQITIDALLSGGPGAWYCVSLSKELSEEIHTLFANAQRSWGSLPVSVTVGNTTWQTSIFRDTKTATYMLPLKAEVRKKERLEAGMMVTFQIKIEV